MVIPVDLCNFVGQVANVRVVEGHVVTISTKHEEVVLEDDACVPISSSWPLTLDVEDLGLGRVASEHWRGSVHETPLSLSLAHLLVIGVEVGGVVVLDQE